jgi:hypothetical protein
MNPEFKKYRDEIQEKNIDGMTLRHRSERLGITPGPETRRDSTLNWCDILGVTVRRVHQAYKEMAPTLMLKMDEYLKPLEALKRRAV